ncbi:MAG: primosomal protein N' [Eubacterium sp.]|nr:primosomal protein N' [Eubacterium sp.]
MALYANVIVDISIQKLDRPFQYLVPEHMLGKLEPGMCVEVPFGKGNSPKKAYVIELTDQAEYDISKLKYISNILTGEVAIESHLFSLAGWIRKYYGGTMNQALKTVLPVKSKVKENQQKIIHLTMRPDEAAHYLTEFKRKKQKARVRLLEALMESETLPQEFLTQKLNISVQTIKSFAQKNFVEIEVNRVYRDPIQAFADLPMAKPFPLNEDQKSIVDEFVKDYEAARYQTYLIHGVTGSGKTEVYMGMIDEVLAKGRQVIVLIPEIALTYQTVMRFYKRYGKKVSILNSRMSAGERYDQYERAKAGDISLIIGPRSALFLPFQNLGLIVIDEEHEGSYKSETVPRYHARETAIARAKMVGASVVLGSATPSIESYYRAKTGRYRLFELTRRAKNQPLPDTKVVDLRAELKRGNKHIFSEALQTAITERLKRHEQSILFLNRRGIAGFVSCRSCGEIIKCPHCDVSLSQHNNGTLVCHYCGYTIPMVKNCPSCSSPYIGGFKAGTQKIEEEIKRLYPQARVLRMDADTTKKKHDYEKILSSFSNEEADILIGTQMIVKGHDFPKVTLVGVLAADLSLGVSDYRASERTFQLLVQAVGRAGRGSVPGEAIIQTYQPEHYSILAAKQQDYTAYYEKEIGYRILMDYPPASNLLYVLVTSKNEHNAQAEVQRMYRAVVNSKIEGLGIIGPAEPAIAKINDVYRKVLYLKHEDLEMLVKIKDALEKLTKQDVQYKNIMIQYDFNPMNFG